VLDNIWDYYARAGVLKDERKDRLIDLERTLLALPSRLKII